MDKIRRSIRKSFKKAPSLTADTATSSAGAVDDGTALKTPWALDEKAVRQGICKFNVKYLGCCEVYESRGVHVCEGALQHLKVDFYVETPSSLKFSEQKKNYEGDFIYFWGWIESCGQGVQQRADSGSDD